MRRTLTLAALATGGLLAAGASAPAAMADDCPNAAVRAQQGVRHLPHCFAYEKVSPHEKNGALVEADSAISRDGSVVSFRSTVSMLEDDTSGHSHLGSAFRGADGWSMDALTDSPTWGTGARLSNTTDYPRWSGISEDGRSLLYATTHPLDPGDLGAAPTLITMDLYLNRPGRNPVWVSAPASGLLTGGAPAGTVPVPVRLAPDASSVSFETSRVMDPDVDATSRNHVWLFRDGQPLELVDRLPDGSVSTATVAFGGTFDAERRVAADRYANRDGSRIVFRSSQLHGAAHIYARVDVGTPQARTVLVSGDAAGTPCPVAPNFEHITESGRYVRFTCAAQLTSEAPTGGGAYVRDLDSGAVTYDEPMADRNDPVVTGHVTPRWSRPEGTYAVDFAPSSKLITRTNLLTGEQECVSCAPGFTGGANAGGVQEHAQGGAGVTMAGLVTADGAVVFESGDRLVPQDTNNATDVYLWENGNHTLLTSGTATSRTTLGGMSLDGSTIAFSTTAALVDEDRDAGARDVYVLRRNGGFLRPADPSECTSGCQGPAHIPPSQTPPLSVGFTDGGNVVDRDVAPISVAGSRAVRGTSLTVKVRVPGAGRVRVSGSGLRSTTRTLKRATTATVKVRLSAKARQTLRRKGSVKAKASVRFVPADGTPQTRRINVTFRQTKATKGSKKSSSRSIASAASGKVAR